MRLAVKTKPASSNALKQRVRNYLVHAETRELGISEVLQSLNEIGPTAIFGGMLRDMLMYGAEGFKSDIDLVVSGEAAELSKVLQKFSPKRTAFGGYRLTYKYSTIDIWSLEDTWAAREGLVRINKLEDLLKTTFFNWDSIAYVVSEKRVLFDANYIDVINSRLLDINLEPNPNPVGVLKRSFERVSRDNALLSPKLVHYLGRVLEENSICAGKCVDEMRRPDFLKFCELLRKHLEEKPDELFAFRDQLTLWNSGS